MDWSIWLTPAKWPPKPHGFTWAMQAAEEIARATHGDRWMGLEFGHSSAHAAINPTDPASGVLDPRYYPAVWFWLTGRTPGLLAGVTKPSDEQWHSAYRRFKLAFEHGDLLEARRQLACEDIRKAAESGALIFHARNEATGEMVLIPRARWNCDRGIAEARLSRGRINLVQPMALEPTEDRQRQVWLARMTSWLFVSEQNLAAFLAGSSSSEDIKRSDEAPAETDPRPPARVSQSRVEKWFREERGPAFDGREPPDWRSCWKAAKERFSPDRVVREVLIAARREGAPAHWQKPGPNRSEVSPEK